MPKRALVFDFGTRKIGIAAANRLSGNATPLVTLPAHDGVPEWHEIAVLIRDWQPEVLVVGLPRNTDGTDSDMTARSRQFAGWLAEKSGLADGGNRRAIHLHGSGGRPSGSATRRHAHPQGATGGRGSHGRAAHGGDLGTVLKKMATGALASWKIRLFHGP